MQKDSVADTAINPDALHFSIGRVEAPHVADLDEPPPRRRLGDDDRQRLFRICRQGLFAKHRLARGEASHGEVCVGGVGRGNYHCVDPVVGDQHQRIGENRGAHCDSLSTRSVRIAESRERGPRSLLPQYADMFRTHHARADDADCEIHFTSSQRCSRHDAWIVSTRV